jgi:hypothetical protein
MAKVIVSGDVKVSESGKQVTLWEVYDYTFKGEHGFVTKEARRKWVIWFEFESPLRSGDWVELEGQFSSKIGFWVKDGETKNVVDHVINDPRILQHKPMPQDKPVDVDDQAKYGLPF